MGNRLSVLGAGICVSVASQASATWSILLMDLSTGEIAIGSATCLTGFDLQANTPVLIPGVGAATAQSFVDVNGINRSLIRDRLLEGIAPQAILDELSVFDGGHQTRQYGLVDTLGRAATFSGTGAGAWAGGETGVIAGAGITGGDVLYAIQGNVLWGPGVVDDAVDAVRTAPGDLPDKLLAGMQAARDAGGDGRCSCSGADPDGCIDQTPDGQKSSDIAYMLVARDGDREGCAPIYRLGSPPRDIEPLDDERFIVSFQGNRVARLAVVRPDRLSSPPVLGEVEFVEPGRIFDEIATGDVTGDGLADVIACAPDDRATWLLAADPDRADGFAEVVRLLDTGHDAVIADLDNDGLNDAVVVDRRGGEIVVLWNDAGVLVPAAPIAVGDTPDEADVGDIDGDGLLDIAVVCRGDATARVIRQPSARVLVADPPRALSVANPSIVTLADIDHDGATEVVVAGLSTDQLEWFDASTGAPEALIPMPSPVRDISRVDLGDGPRVFVTGLSGSAVLEPLFPGGPVVYDESLRIFQQPVRTLPRDLDGDGDQDLAIVGLTGQSVRFIDNVDGSLPLFQGCGDGDFFMEFNIAFSDRADPDPVDQLEGLFDAWADELVGLPDAVRSDALADGPFVSSIDACSTTLRVRLLDRAGNPAAATGLSVEPAPGGDAILEVGGIVPTGPGIFEVELLGTGAQGTQALVITAQTDRGGVRLMPELGLRVDDPADLDGDGDRDADDLALWISAYKQGDLAADQNLDGLVDPADFSAWILNRNRACN